MPQTLPYHDCTEIEEGLSQFLGQALSPVEQQTVRQIVDDINTGKLRVTHGWGNNYSVVADGFLVSVYCPNENTCIELTDAAKYP